MNIEGVEYLSTSQVAEILGVTKNWVRYLVKQGKFVNVKKGIRRSYWISKEEVNDTKARIPSRNRLIER